MPDNKIEELLKKYLEGRASPEEEARVDEWYNSLSATQPKAELSNHERLALRNIYWNALKHSMSRQAAKGLIFWPRLLGVAASVAAIAVMTTFLFPSERPGAEVAGSSVPMKMEMVSNNSNVSRQVDLPDGSEVMLSPGSTLQYAAEFNYSERKIHLSGAAFFDISHDKEKPFYVFANEVVTKVLGTSFSVTAYPNDVSITVAVTSGKVSVYAHPDHGPLMPDGEKVILTPNQQAIYTKNDHKVSRSLVKDPQIVIPAAEVDKIRFEGVAVSEIFKALEKMYNVEIDFEEELFSKCSITTSVSGKDLYERIDVICEITGATYELDDTTIRISGTGCN